MIAGPQNRINVLKQKQKISPVRHGRDKNNWQMETAVIQLSPPAIAAPPIISRLPQRLPLPASATGLAAEASAERRATSCSSCSASAART
eukprot:SAG11_NODE_1055_length_6017_cov_1.548496_4_plen_90_part_00